MAVPDNVLFEGGAGEMIRKKRMATCDLHSILRLPTGLFYTQGVKANVIFFEKKPASKEAWTDFLKCYNPGSRHRRKETVRFKKFGYTEIEARENTNLDIFWLKDESLGDMENLPDPDVLAQESVENLET